jgi:hypothetical protein
MRSAIQAVFKEVGSEIRWKWRREHLVRANGNAEEEI